VYQLPCTILIQLGEIHRWQIAWQRGEDLNLNAKQVN
jgi:hypothetical protein